MIGFLCGFLIGSAFAVFIIGLLLICKNPDPKS